MIQQIIAILYIDYCHVLDESSYYLLSSLFGLSFLLQGVRGAQSRDECFGARSAFFFNRRHSGRGIAFDTISNLRRPKQVPKRGFNETTARKAQNRAADQRQAEDGQKRRERKQSTNLTAEAN